MRLKDTKIKFCCSGTETLDIGPQPPEKEKRPSHVHTENVPTSPRDINQHSTQTQSPTDSSQLSEDKRYETDDGKFATKITTQQDEEKREINKPITEQEARKSQSAKRALVDATMEGDQLLDRIPEEKESNQPGILQDN